MSTDQTINVEPIAAQLRSISAGSDGESLLGFDYAGNAFEMRVLGRVSLARLDDIRYQLSLLDLVHHAGIRKLVEPMSADDPPAFKLAIPHGVDLVEDRLDQRIGGLSIKERLQVAAGIVDASSAAHHLGLCHGSFLPSSILIEDGPDRPKAHVDFSSSQCVDLPSIDFQCNDISSDVVLSVEHDLIQLQSLMELLLSDVVEADGESDEARVLPGRKRAILRQWMGVAGNAAASEPPSLGQWQSILGEFTSKTQSDDQTGIVAPPSVRVGSGSTSRLYAGQSSEHSEPETPDQLGRFRIDAKIGEGGMGTVYRATDLANGETVAIKLLRVAGKDMAQSIRRFHKEARLLVDVQNDHVTRLIDVGEDEGRHFLAMEYIDGIDLKNWLSGRSALPEIDALRLTADLARALVDAHSREVIHRDIKPENVLLKLNDDASDRETSIADRPITDFTLKLTDFGIARHVNQSESMEVTRAGSVIGTPKYMSPEQCKSSDELTPTADVYSIGISMFQFLTGSPPFDSDDFMKLAGMHCFDPVPSVRKRNAEISDATSRIVQRALAKKPEDRFGDAGQMLAEILQVLRGEASDIEAHPKLPETHQAAKLWEKSVQWEMDSEPAELWPLVSNTERLNEAIGLPAVEYRTEKDAKLGIRKFGSFSLSGVKVSWEEHPFEWIEGRRMGILREFDSGPFKWFMSVVTLDAKDGGGSTLSHQVRIEPRNLFGRVLTKVEADWKGFRNLERVYQRMDRSIQGRLASSQSTDPFKETKPLSNHQTKRLHDRIERLLEAGVDPKVSSSLQSAIKHWSAQELAQLRPLAMADQLGVGGPEMIDACLIAASEGILNLRWDVLCPTCRVSAMTNDKLSQINAHTHCQACDVDFQSNLAGSIEMVFQAHPEIREINDGQYCIGGPEHSPHVVAQVRVDANECLDLTLNLASGDYLVRGPRIPQTQTLRVQSKASPSMADLSLSTLGGTHTPKLRSGRQTLTINNDTESLHVVRIERMIPRADVVTAAMASANPLFRRLFPHQQFASDNPIETDTMTFLATSINNIDDLYHSMGDAEAYAAIHQHQVILDGCVTGATGTVVKTVGEKLLACFAERQNAVIAANRIRRMMSEEQAQRIKLGIGIHCGPTLVTTQNNQLDYFGSTVRAVNALPENAGCDTLMTEAIYTDPKVIDQLPNISSSIEIFDLPGSPKHRTKRISTEKSSP